MYSKENAATGRATPFSERRASHRARDSGFRVFCPVLNFFVRPNNDVWVFLDSAPFTLGVLV